MAARPWIQRLLEGPELAAPPPEPLALAPDPIPLLSPAPNPLTPEGRAWTVAQIAKAMGKHVPDAKDKPKDDFHGLDWDEELATLLFSGDKPNQGHPGARWLHFSTLRQASEMSICAPFVMKRVQQMLQLSKLQADKYAFGVKLKLRDDKPMTPAAQKEAREIWARLNNYEPFHTSMQKLALDSWPFDQATAEVLEDRAGRPWAFRALDASTIRRGRPKIVGDAKAKLVNGNYAPPRYESDTYVQMLRDRVVRVFDRKQILWIVRRPRSSIETFGYGYPEIQQAYDAILAYLNADSYNQYYFQNGMHASAILQVKSRMDRKAWNAFKAVMTAQIKGIHNSHRLAMILLNPGSGEGDRGESIEKTEMSQTNRDMQFKELLLMQIMLIAANFNMMPSEAGLPEFRDAGGRALSQANPKDEILLSRKFGLLPALVAFEDAFNTGFVQRYDEDFEMRFVADSETEQARIELGAKLLQGGLDSYNGQATELDKPVIDEKFFKDRKIKVADDLRDRIILCANLPLSQTMISAISQLQSAEPDPNAGAPGPEMGGPPGQPGEDGDGGFDLSQAAGMVGGPKGGRPGRGDEGTDDFDARPARGDEGTDDFDVRPSRGDEGTDDFGVPPPRARREPGFRMEGRA